MKKIFIVFFITSFLFNILLINLSAQDTSSISPEKSADTTKTTSIEVEKEEKPEKLKAKYVGAKECGVCHDGEKMGNIYTNWQEQRHAKAFERLKGSDKTNPKCLKCHTTGYGGEKLYEEVNLEGVQCEACHGPGSLYRPMKIMEDRKKSNDLGLIFPIDPQIVCKKCHLHRQDRATPLCPGRD